MICGCLLLDLQIHPSSVFTFEKSRHPYLIIDASFAEHSDSVTNANIDIGKTFPNQVCWPIVDEEYFEYTLKTSCISIRGDKSLFVSLFSSHAMWLWWRHLALFRLYASASANPRFIDNWEGS